MIELGTVQSSNEWQFILIPTPTLEGKGLVLEYDFISGSDEKVDGYLLFKQRWIY